MTTAAYEKAMKAKADKAIQKARDIYVCELEFRVADEDMAIQIDAKPKISPSHKGTWVAAWVWVKNEEDGEDGRS